MVETRTVHDPFLGKDVQINDRLVDRLRGNYACGPHLPNGRPEFGWRQFEAPSIQHEAAVEIERLRAALAGAEASFEFIRLKLINCLEEPERSAFWKAVEARDALRIPQDATAPEADHG
jgi:hypothetical protein